MRRGRALAERSGASLPRQRGVEPQRRGSNFDGRRILSCAAARSGVLFGLFGRVVPNRHFFRRGLTIQVGEP